jgi:phage FluMu gp28-like protein|tara:strand:+ start:1851 stop:3233 length:1383 start_codon:yes stop_codon:yes gene_type:complete
MTRPTNEEVEEREQFMQTVADCATNPSKFSEVFLDHKLFDYNQKYVNCQDRFIVYRSGRQVGKTMSTAVKAIHFAFFAPIMLETVKNECIIVIAAPTQNQATIMFDRIRSLIVNNEFLKGMIVRNTQSEMWVNFLDGRGMSKIITRATGETGTSLRGYSPHCIIADECSFIKTSILKAFLPSGMATHARVWLTSTPFSKSGYFFEACQNSKPTNPDGMWREFHVKSTDSPLIQEDPTFVEEIKKLTRDEYVQEVEGEFLDIGNALIPNSLIKEAITDFKPKGRVRYYMGVDIARTGRDETVFTVIGVDENDTVFVEDVEAEAQSNVVDVCGRVGELVRNYGLERVFVDETGLGGGLVDLAREQDLPCQGVIFSLQQKAEMYKNLRLLFENHKIKLKDINKLVYQLSYLRREYTETGIMKIRSDEHDDYPDSLVLACKAVNSGGGWHVMDVSEGLKKALFG